MENQVVKLAPLIELNNGEKMPSLGLGTWRSFSKDCENAVKFAIDCGYRLIDTAYVYNNEVEVGKAINKKINENVVERKDLFVITKLAGQHNDPSLVEYACRQSLNNLGLNHIDLYLIHFPVGEDDTDYIDTWQEMEKLVDMGLTKSIGLSNFNSQQIIRILEMCRIRPVVNQVECHPGFNQKKLIEFAKQHDIIIIGYCPLGRPKPKERKPDFLFNKSMEELFEKYHRTPPQIALRYLIQNGVVPIPKSSNPNRISQNFHVFDFELSKSDMDTIDLFNKNQRLISFTGLKGSQHFPFDIEY